MSDDDVNGCLLVIFAVMIFIAGFNVGGILSARVERTRAVKAGVGRWTTNAKTGETTFVYGPTTEPLQ